MSKQDVDNAEGDFAAKKATVDSAAANVKRLEDRNLSKRSTRPLMV